MAKTPSTCVQPGFELYLTLKKGNLRFFSLAVIQSFIWSACSPPNGRISKSQTKNSNKNFNGCFV